MHRRAYIIALAGLICATQSAMARTRTGFEGVLTVSAAAGCDEIKVGQKLNSVFHVARYAGNDNFSAVSTLKPPYSGDVYQRNGGVFGKAPTPVAAIHFGAGYRTYSAKVALPKQVPSTLSAGTSSVQVTFRIQGARNRPGCNATFSGTLRKSTKE